MNHITLFSATTCNPCKIVRDRLDAAGIPFTEVKLDLPENAEVLANLKRTLEREIIQTPLIRYAGKYHTLVDLTSIITNYKETH